MEKKFQFGIEFNSIHQALFMEHLCVENSSSIPYNFNINYMHEKWAESLKLQHCYR